MARSDVLVTGGAGFIGSHCCKALAASGYSPTVYDNLSTGNVKAVKWGDFVKGDIRDTETLVDTLRRLQPDSVIHFAASAYVGESASDPAKYYRNNVGGMISLLDACVETGVKKIVFSSSCATYGTPEMLPIREATEQRPINPYGRTKLICEQMLSDYAHVYGTRYVALRYFNAAGADPDGELGEWHDPETHLLPRTFMAAFGVIDELEVFGDDHPTSDGTCVRDYVHVTDLAQAHLNALRYLEGGGKNLLANLGTGTGYSIGEIIAAVEQTTSRKVPHVFRDRRAGDPPILVADNSLAKSALHFEPVHSSLESIVRTAAPFFDPSRISFRAAQEIPGE